MIRGDSCIFVMPVRLDWSSSRNLPNVTVICTSAGEVLGVGHRIQELEGYLGGHLAHPPPGSAGSCDDIFDRWLSSLLLENSRSNYYSLKYA